MTTQRDFDMRVTALLDELASPRIPDYVGAIAAETRQISQRRSGLAWPARVTWPVGRPQTATTQLLAIALAIALLGAVALGGAMFASWLDSRTPAVVFPSPLSAVTPTPSSSASSVEPCAGAVSESDALRTFLVGTPQSERAWRAGSGPRFSGMIAGFTDESAAVVLVDSNTRVTCELVGLSGDISVQGSPGTTLAWAPSGDALAIGGPTDTAGTLLIWSATGLREVWSGTNGPTVAWSNDGSRVAAMPSRLKFGGVISADGFPDTHVDGSPSRLAWSPSGLSLAMQSLDPFDEAGVTPIEIADGTGQRTLAAGDAPPVLIGWLDDETLLGEDGASLVEIAIANPAAVTVRVQLGHPLGVAAVPVQTHVSPDLRHAAYVGGVALPGPEDDHLQIVDLTTGSEISVNARPVPELMSWSPDGSQLAFTYDEPRHRVWVVNADGSGLRPVSDIAVYVLDGSWQP